MPGLRVPSEYEPGIVIIRSLSDSDISSVIEVLKSASLPSDPNEIIPLLKKVLPKLPSEDVENFFETLYSLYLFRAHSDVSIGLFVHDLSEAIGETENPKLRITDPKEQALLRARLESLLTVRPFSTISKAHGLRYDFANLFWDAKIFSDIRPVWNGDATKPPEGVVITHTLKLEYHRAGGRGEIYVHVDSDDIERLLAVLRRAQDKDATLKSLSAESKWLKILDQ